MEARLLQARNYQGFQPMGRGTWHVHKAELGGIPVSPSQFEFMPGSLLELKQEASEFLLELLGNNGAWKGWVLHAIGNMNERLSGGNYFDMVLVRKSEAKLVLTPSADGSEVGSPIVKAE